jgi:hypothetical protein
LWNFYSAPDGFDIYMTGDDKQFIIDQDSSDFNAVERARELDY